MARQCLMLLFLFCSLDLFPKRSQVITVRGESCSEGFMDLSLLRVKAEQITSMVGSMLPTPLIDGTRWIIPDYRFTCGGMDNTLTGVLLGPSNTPVNVLSM